MSWVRSADIFCITNALPKFAIKKYSNIFIKKKEGTIKVHIPLD